jgi:phospholipase/carboxylesterase
VLAGFSQGGAIALQTGLRYPEKLAGIMALSCYLPCSDSFAAEAAAANAKTPVLIAHGTQDPVVGYAMGQNTHDVLVKSGYPVEWHEYPMQHSVCMEEVRDIGSWLTRVMRN